MSEGVKIEKAENASVEDLPEVPVEDPIKVEPIKRLSGEIDLPGGPDISLMALALGARVAGPTEIVGCSRRPVVQKLQEILCDLGVTVDAQDDSVTVTGGGLRKLDGTLDAGSSGILFACLAGLLADVPFRTELAADPSLADSVSAVLDALDALGAKSQRPLEGTLPATIGGVELRAGSYGTEEPNTEVKCAMFLAAPRIEGQTELRQATAGDDDMEVLLKASGCPPDKGRVEGADGHRIVLSGPAELKPARHDVPGDATCALLAVLAASLLKRSEVNVNRVGVDWRTRRLLDLLRRMNVQFEMARTRTESGFHTRQLKVKAAELRPIRIAEPYSTLFLDELPILAVAGACIGGETVIRDAQALRDGRTDRVSLVVENLRRMGARVGEMPDGLVVKGEGRLQGADLDAGGDPGVALAFMLGGLKAEGGVTIQNPGPVNKEYPGFFDSVCEAANR